MKVYKYKGFVLQVDDLRDLGFRRTWHVYSIIRPINSFNTMKDAKLAIDKGEV